MTHENRTEAASIAVRRTATRVTLALLLGGAASIAVAALSHAGTAPAPGVASALRGHTFRGLDGRTLTLESLRGQVVVLNLWASWCAPCRRELPELDAFHREIAKQGGRVLAVSIDLEPRNAVRFVRRLGLALPVYHDGTDGLARRLDLKSVPYTVVLDRSGDVAFTGHGANPHDLERMKSVTRALVAAPPALARTAEGE